MTPAQLALLLSIAEYIQRMLDGEVGRRSARGYAAAEEFAALVTMVEVENPAEVM